MKLTRDEIQKEALALYKTHKFIALEWCTGLGKSKAAIDIIEYLKSTKKSPRILLVVAEIAHKNNWRLDFHKWEHSMSGIEVTTYASFKKYADKEFDLIVLDEAHHVGSDLRLTTLNSITVHSLVCLSATLPEDTKVNIERTIFCKLVPYKIALQEAIDAEILPKPQINLIEMTLDNTIRNHIVVEERGKKDKRVTIRTTIDNRWTYMKDKGKYPNLTLELTCTEYEKYWFITSSMDYWKRIYMSTRNEGIKTKWLLYGSTRKRYLGSLKTFKANEVVKTLKGKRYVCFCSSIEQADILHPENSIHSKKEGSLDIIDSFNDKEIDSLYPIGMIQEGQNLVDIDAAVIIQLDGTERPFVQKTGRAMRAKEPELYIIYFKDTQDEKYLKDALTDINPEYINQLKL